MVVTLQLINKEGHRLGISLLEVPDTDSVPHLVRYGEMIYQLFWIENMIIFKYREMVVTEITDIIEG